MFPRLTRIAFIFTVDGAVLKITGLRTNNVQKHKSYIIETTLFLKSWCRIIYANSISSPRLLCSTLVLFATQIDLS